MINGMAPFWVANADKLKMTSQISLVEILAVHGACIHQQISLSNLKLVSTTVNMRNHFDFLVFVNFCYLKGVLVKPTTSIRRMNGLYGK